MIKVSLYKNSNQNFIGAKLDGHAGYAENGFDIVCSAVSILVINTINSIEALTKDDYVCEMDQKNKGHIDFKISDAENPSHDALLLINSMVIGLKALSEDYGREFILTDY